MCIVLFKEECALFDIKNSFRNDFCCLVFQVCQELADVQAKRALIEAVMDETKQLQEVGGYPFYRLSQ
jgi:hypothetical protein